MRKINTEVKIVSLSDKYLYFSAICIFPQFFALITLFKRISIFCPRND